VPFTVSLKTPRVRQIVAEADYPASASLQQDSGLALQLGGRYRLSLSRRQALPCVPESVGRSFTVLGSRSSRVTVRRFAPDDHAAHLAAGRSASDDQVEGEDARAPGPRSGAGERLGSLRSRSISGG